MEIIGSPNGCQLYKWHSPKKKLINNNKRSNGANYIEAMTKHINVAMFDKVLGFSMFDCFQ